MDRIGINRHLLSEFGKPVAKHGPMVPGVCFLFALPGAITVCRLCRGDWLFGLCPVPQAEAVLPDLSTQAFSPSRRTSDSSAAHLASGSEGVSEGASVTYADIRRGDVCGLMLRNYELGTRIGQGGMGQVFRAQHSVLGRSLAIKFLASEILLNSEAEHRFRDEIQSLGQLQHPHILNAIDAGNHGGIQFLVTEYIDGHDLGHLVQANGKLSVTRCCEIIKQAAAGLAFAHSRGFVHRDIKPSNIVLDQNGHVRILDFGLVRNQCSQDGLTQAGQFLGTVDFIAPEQAADSRTADGRSDLYSLGCTFLFLLTGTPPFCGEQFSSIAAKIHGHLFEVPPALAEVRPEWSPALKSCLQRLLAKNPTDRYQSADEVIADLDALIFSDRQDSGTDRISSRMADRAEGALQRPQKQALVQRYGYLPAILLLACLACVAGGGLKNTGVEAIPESPPSKPIAVHSPAQVDEVPDDVALSGDGVLSPSEESSAADAVVHAEEEQALTANSEATANAEGHSFGVPGKLLGGKAAELFNNRRRVNTGE